MASTRPAWALNLGSGISSYHEKWWDFDSEQDIADFAWTVVGGVGGEQCGWQGSIALQDGINGEVLLTNDDQDDDSIIGQSKQEGIRFNGLGKTTYLVARLKLSDATQCDVMFGAWKTDTTPLGGTAGASDGIWFRKDDGDTTWDCVRAFNAGNFPDDYTQEATSTAATTNYVVLVIRIITSAATAAQAQMDFSIDGVTVATSATTASIVNDEELALGFGIMNGEAASKTLTIDAVGFIQER